jgi:hypothetical protein
MSPRFFPDPVVEHPTLMLWRTLAQASESAPVVCGLGKPSFYFLPPAKPKGTERRAAHV